MQRGNAGIRDLTGERSLPLRVVISGRHTQLSGRLKEYARQKVGRLERLDGNVTQAELVLSREFHGRRDCPDGHLKGGVDDCDETEAEPAPRVDRPEELTGEVGAAELIVSVAREHRPFVARADGESLFAAVDLVVDKMERQLRRHKEKLKGRHRRARD